MIVNVGPKYSSEYVTAIDLFLLYQITVGKDISITYYDVDELYDHYGVDVNVAILTRTHPDINVQGLINKKLTKFIEILKYNDGNIYHITLDEEPFYKEYPYYHKFVIDKSTLGDYYNNLVINDDVFDNKKNRPIETYHSMFINTISVKYHLLSNITTPRAPINELLHNMKFNMNKLNQLRYIVNALNTASFTDFTIQLPTHPGAISFYESKIGRAHV